MPTSSTARALGIGLAILVAAVIAAVVAADQRSSILGEPGATSDATGDAADGDAAADDAEVFGAAVADATRELASPAHAARESAADLRSATAEAIVASEDIELTRERIELRAERLRAAADDLDDASTPTIPVRSGAVPTATVERVLDRVELTGDQASVVAELARDGAEHTERLALATLELSSQAAAFAEATEDLPDGDDPDAVAGAWRDDLDAVASYREAAEGAGDHDELDAVASAHLAVVEAFEQDAQTALDLLEAGDVDGYNAHREDRLPPTVALVDDLLPAAQESLEAAVAQVEEVEGRALALLTELEALRTDVPEQLAAT